MLTYTNINKTACRRGYLLFRGQDAKWSRPISGTPTGPRLQWHKPNSVSAFAGGDHLSYALGACPAVLLQVRLIPEDLFPLSRKSERATRSSALSCTAWGLSCDPACARIRWALTPPFHPYPAPFWASISHGSGRPTTKMVRGGIFSGTLSVTRGLLHGSPRFREACRPMVFGLSSGG